MQKALSAAMKVESSSSDKNKTVNDSPKDTIDRETSMGYDKGSMEERSAENGFDRGKRTADIPREVPSSSEAAQGNSNQFRGTKYFDRRGDRTRGEGNGGQKVPVFQYQTATPYQKARIDELISLAFDASEEWRDFLQKLPEIDITSEVMRMYEEGNPRLRDLKETVPGLSEALYEVAAFIRQTTARQTETAGQTAEQRGDTSLSEASDSDGNWLTKAQRDYFKDSVFRDREGRLLVLYHGSHFESFSVFELFRGIWMTTDKAYAETFAEFRDESEPLDGEIYTDEDLKLYRLYAKAEHPANLGEIDGKLTEERLHGLAESLHIDYRTLENLFGYDIGKNATFAVTRTERFIQLAREQGFDSFTATESGVPTYCVFANRNQVALTTNKAPTEHMDIRYSKKDKPRRIVPTPEEAKALDERLKAREAEKEAERLRIRNESMRKLVENAPANVALRERNNIKRSAKDNLAEMAEKNGRMQQGESPVRDVTVPVSTDGETKVRRTVRTAMEAEATPKEMIPHIEESIVEGNFNYKPKKNAKTMDAAREWVERRVDVKKAYEDWLSEKRRYTEVSLSAPRKCPKH